MQQEKSDNKAMIYIMAAIGFLVVFFIVLHYTEVSATAAAPNLLTDLIDAFNHMSSKPLSFKHVTAGSLMTNVMIAGLAYFIAVVLIINHIEQNAHADPKTAQGSSDWNKDFKGYAKLFTIPQKNKNTPDENMILAKGLKYGLKQGRNVNVVIMGSAGSGKSFGVIKPNLLQMNTSFVVTDPSGEIFRAEAKLLMENGYNVKIFSTSNMASSNCYNPFDYIYDEDGEIDETRITSMISMFMANASDMQNAGKGDPFWDKSSKALLTACAMLLLEFYPPETHNMYHMLRLVQKGKTSENSKGDEKTDLDKMFDEARLVNPQSHCFSSYDTFKLAPARTANSILISAAVDLNMFNQTKVRNMTTTAYQVQARNLEGKILRFAKDSKGELIRTDDNIDLRTVGDEKTAIFINIPQADGTFNFLVSMMYSQLFESLYGRAEKICPKKWMIMNDYGKPLISMIDSEEDAKKLAELYANAEIVTETEKGHDTYYLYNRLAGDKFTHPGYKSGHLKKVYSKEVAQYYIDCCKNMDIKKGKALLPWHVQCLLDEFSNIGSIPEFPQKLATMRKYEISCMIVLQSLSQLKNRYDKLWPDILSNCDNTIFLGTSDPDTCEYVSKRLGPKTIRVVTHGTSNSGKGKSGSTNESFQKRELMTPDEVSRIPNTKCIIMTNGQKPFLVDKEKALNHPNWNKSGDVDKSMQIEPTEYINCSEKSKNAANEEQTFKQVLSRAASGQRADGSRAMTVKPVKSDEDLKKSFGIAQRTPKPFVKKGDESYNVDGIVPGLSAANKNAS